ncbi:hypothetical protein SAMN02745248_01129 [Hathewaya proteolytica DSM 3090]|uniref:Flagellar Assembly Protein A N-terminal region domain-containing protein n=1 Tax=Hathewaya proteolytica DSM 3090 TaxID=1121331 RepID=A0A1M6MRS0_9CLOT|nr:FapA family protein [Hathewaya proteolytica]SHJ85973.1 hypothetical protein SAMN02745248_01129 [Hathewaya proteolytica DSM 3090]
MVSNNSNTIEQLKELLNKDELTEISDKYNIGITDILLGVPTSDEELDVWNNMSEQEILEMALLSQSEMPNYSESQFEVLGDTVNKIKVNELKQRLAKARKNNGSKDGGGDIGESVERFIEVMDNNSRENISIRPVNERIQIDIGKDLMEARISIKHPIGNEREVTVEDIKEVLSSKNITTGIKYEYIQRLVENPIYDTFFKIAYGKPAVNGTDGKVELLFNKDTKSVRDDNKTVDYRNISTINSVEKDELLCKIHQATLGEDGYDIRGKILVAKNGVPVKNPAGNNVYFDETGTSLYAECNGEATYNKYKGTVSVNKLLVIDNVDISSGNINFAGSVVIRGNVSEGFSVTSLDDIKIDGTVEGATLRAGGNIIIRKGMNGGMMQQGHIFAGGAVSSYFFENVTINAKGDVVADTILNCKINVLGDIILRGKRASIIGGQYVTAGSLVAGKIGSEAGVFTKIILKSRESIMSEQSGYLKQIARYEDTISKLKKAADMVDNIELNDKEKQTAKLRSIIAIRKLEKEIKNLNKEVEDLQKHVLSKRTFNSVKASREMYSNVVIFFDKMRYYNDDVHYDCIVYNLNGDVKLIESRREE